MRHISDDQRRARLGSRHAFAPDSRVESVEAATAAMTCLHATEPATVYLSLFARTECAPKDIERALYDERSIVKQLAMRRTLFTFPRALLPAVWGSASRRVATQQRAQLAKDVVKGAITSDGPTWVAENTQAVLTMLTERRPMTTMQLRAEIPSLDARFTYGEGKAYGATLPIAPRVLTTLAAEGAIVRGVNDGGWKSSRPFWTPTLQWLGSRAEPLDEHSGYKELIGHWLRTFGPGTEDDIVWWLGATKAAVRRALADLKAVEVTLDGGATGWVHADDTADVEGPQPWAALLPILDPTTMGWKQRDFYLGPHKADLFDSNGNGGTTAWWGGRIVGGWHQAPDGTVVVDLLEEVPAAGRTSLDDEARRLTAWLEGDVVNSVYHSPLTRRQLRSQGDP